MINIINVYDNKRVGSDIARGKMHKTYVWMYGNITLKNVGQRILLEWKIYNSFRMAWTVPKRDNSYQSLKSTQDQKLHQRHSSFTNITRRKHVITGNIAALLHESGNRIDPRATRKNKYLGYHLLKINISIYCLTNTLKRLAQRNNSITLCISLLSVE